MLVIQLSQYFAIIVRRRCLQLLTNNIERLIQIPTTLYEHFIPTPVTGISDRLTARGQHYKVLFIQCLNGIFLFCPHL